MYVTPNPNFRNSIRFLSCVRDVLAGVVSESSVDHKEELIYYILNEATDYEVMHLFVEETLPDKKFDLVEEILLFSKLKEQMENTEGLSELMGEELYNEVLQEVDTISPFQSSKVLMEDLEYFLEVSADIAAETAKAKAQGAAALRKLKALSAPTKSGISSAQKAQAKSAFNKLAALYKKGLIQLKGDALVTYKKAAGALGTAAGKGSQIVGKGMEAGVKGAVKGAKYIGKETAKGGKALGKGFAKAGKEVGSKGREVLKKSFERPTTLTKPMPRTTGGGGVKAVGQWSKGAKKLTDVPAQVAKKTSAASGKLAQKAGSMPGMKAGTFSKTGGLAKGSKAWYMAHAKNKLHSAKQMASQLAKTPAAKGVAGVALAGLLAYGAHKVYKNYMSQAAKACRGTGTAKDTCMKKFRAKAIDAEIKDLKSAMSACKNSKNPQKCKAGVSGKINKLTAKKAKLA